MHSRNSFLTCLLLALFACDTRRDKIGELCAQLSSCQTRCLGSEKATDTFKSACMVSIGESLDLGQSTDAKMVQCQRCIQRLGDACADIYAEHKCDQACEGFKWVTGPQGHCRDALETCTRVIQACDPNVEWASARVSPATAGAAGAATCPAAGAASHPPDAVSLAGAVSGTNSATAANATNTEDTSGVNAWSHQLAVTTAQCAVTLQGYLWGDALAYVVGAHGAGGSAPSTATEATPIAVDLVSAKTLHECQTCVTAQPRDASSCHDYEAACATPCSAVPKIGRELANSPGAALCQVAFVACSKFFAPAPDGIENCMTAIGAMSQTAEESPIDCARCVAAVSTSPTAPCAAILAGNCRCACGPRLRSLLFEPSVGYQLSRLALCGTAELPDIATDADFRSRMNQLSTVPADLAPCLSCLNQEPAACNALPPAQLAQAGQAGQATVAAEASLSDVGATGPCNSLCRAVTSGGAAPSNTSTPQ